MGITGHMGGWESQTGHQRGWASLGIREVGHHRLGIREGEHADASADVRCPHSTGLHDPRLRGATPGAPCQDSSVTHVIARYGHNYTMTSGEAKTEQDEAEKKRKKKRKKKEEKEEAK